MTHVEQAERWRFFFRRRARPTANPAKATVALPSDEQLMARFVLNFTQEFFGVGDILMSENFYFGAGEARAVNDAGMVELVGQNEIFFAEDAGDSAGIGGEAGLKDDAGFDTLEARDLFLEFHMDMHGACNGSDGSGAYTIFFCGGNGSFLELGMVAEAEVIVGREIDDALAVIGADWGLLIIQFTKLEESTALT